MHPHLVHVGTYALCLILAITRPAAEYGQIKLVAAMMNGRKHWFAEGGAAGDGSQPGAGSGSGPAATPPAAASMPAGENGAPAGENVALNCGGFASSQQLGSGCEHEAKRPRLSSGEGRGSTAPLPPLDRGTLTAWLAACGGATAPQLVAHFCRSGGSGGAAGQQVQQQREAELVALLAGLCEEFEIMRRGGNSGFSAVIDLADAEVHYLVI